MANHAQGAVIHPNAESVPACGSAVETHSAGAGTAPVRTRGLGATARGKGGCTLLGRRPPARGKADVPGVLCTAGMITLAWFAP